MKIIELENDMLVIIRENAANVMSKKDWRWVYGQLYPEHWIKKRRKK